MNTHTISVWLRVAQLGAPGKRRHQEADAVLVLNSMDMLWEMLKSRARIESLGSSYILPWVDKYICFP